jgi:hypothetical protein
MLYMRARAVLMLWHAFLFLGLRHVGFFPPCFRFAGLFPLLVRNFICFFYSGHTYKRSLVLKTINFLQEKAVEATKQEKERKEEKT